MSALHVTKGNFDEEVLNSDKLVLVDFWAPWCGPCQMLTPIIEELADEQTDVKICKVNVDEEPELAMDFQVVNIPTLMVMKHGKMVQKEIGVRSKEEILSMING